jgi:hypothetical protein
LFFRRPAIFANALLAVGLFVEVKWATKKLPPIYKLLLADDFSNPSLTIKDYDVVNVSVERTNINSSFFGAF